MVNGVGGGLEAWGVMSWVPASSPYHSMQLEKSRREEKHAKRRKFLALLLRSTATQLILALLLIQVSRLSLQRLIWESQMGSLPLRCA